MDLTQTALCCLPQELPCLYALTDLWSCERLTPNNQDPGLEIAAYYLFNSAYASMQLESLDLCAVEVFVQQLLIVCLHWTHRTSM